MIRVVRADFETMWRAGAPVAQIARRFDCSIASVSRIARRFDLPARIRGGKRRDQAFLSVGIERMWAAAAPVRTIARTLHVSTRVVIEMTRHLAPRASYGGRARGIKARREAKTKGGSQ